MVKNARGLPAEVVAREIDATLGKAIARALNEWGRAVRLPPLTWSIEHWEGYVTVVGTPSRRFARKSSAARRWAADLDLEPADDGAPRWHLSKGAWHVEIRG